MLPVPFQKTGLVTSVYRKYTETAVVQRHTTLKQAGEKWNHRDINDFLEFWLVDELTDYGCDQRVGICTLLQRTSKAIDTISWKLPGFANRKWLRSYRNIERTNRTGWPITQREIKFIQLGWERRKHHPGYPDMKHFYWWMAELLSRDSAEVLKIFNNRYPQGFRTYS